MIGFAIFTAIRRASSLVSSLAADRRPPRARYLPTPLGDAVAVAGGALNPIQIQQLLRHRRDIAKAAGIFRFGMAGRGQADIAALKLGATEFRQRRQHGFGIWHVGIFVHVDFLRFATLRVARASARSATLELRKRAESVQPAPAFLFSTF